MEVALGQSSRVIVRGNVERKKLDIHPLVDASCYVGSLIATSSKVSDIVTVPLAQQASIPTQFKSFSLIGLFKLSLYAIGFLTWFISAWCSV